MRVFSRELNEREALRCWANICLGRYNVSACPVKSSVVSVLKKYSRRKRSVNWEADRRLRSDYDM